MVKDILNPYNCLLKKKKNQPNFLRDSDKSLLSPEQNRLKEIWESVL